MNKEEKEQLAKEAYQAYSEATNNKNFLGKEMPNFNDLPDTIKNAWVAAVTKVVFILRNKI